MKILALDTSTEACSAALFIDGQVIEKYEVCPRLHTKKILGMVEAILNEADLDLSQLNGIAYGKGPGSFTGVRLAVSIAQGLGFSSNIPLVPVSSLAAMGLYALKQCSQIDTVITALDARMDQIYMGVFKLQQQELVPLMDETLQDWQDPSAPESLSGVSLIGCGHGFKAYPELKQLLNHDFVDVLCDVLPHAAEIAVLAQPILKAKLGLSPQECHASYLRQDIVQSKT